MNYFIRLTAMCALSTAALASVPAAADYDGPDGYGTHTTDQFDVSYDGYGREGQESPADDPTTYVVIEAESGATETIEGETVIVVQEPEPTAATEHAPPPPRTVVIEQSVASCSEGIWVDGYWAYAEGDYVWVDGHCVVERVNYVFVHPRWDYYSNVWWFVPGYYRPYGVYVGFGYYRPWHWYPPYHHAYYRTRYPVPVHRGVARRPTTVRATPAPRRGVVARPGYTGGRTTTVGRVGATPTRTGAVTRTAGQTRVVGRAATTRTGTVGRAGAGPSMTRTVPRLRPTGTVVSQPRVNPARASSVRRPASTSSSRGLSDRPSTAPTRTSSVRSPGARRPSLGRPSSAASRRGSVGRSSVGRPSIGSSRSGSVGRPSFGRPGGFSRPSSGGFGGSRSVPTARGR
jgi:hypothetical protein